MCSLLNGGIYDIAALKIYSHQACAPTSLDELKQHPGLKTLNSQYQHKTTKQQLTKPIDFTVKATG